MHGRAKIISCIRRLTIVPESTVFGLIRKTPTISKSRHFDGRTDGILFVEIFLSMRFQRLMRLVENRVGVTAFGGSTTPLTDP